MVIDSNRVGTGSAWRTDQSSHLLVNTVAEQVTISTDGTIEMAGPVDRGIHSEWSNFLAKIGNFAGLPTAAFGVVVRISPDTYPPRAFYGHYLRWAFERTRDRYAE